MARVVRTTIDLRQVVIGLLLPVLLVVGIEVVSVGDDPVVGSAAPASTVAAAVAEPVTFTIAVTGELLPHPSIVGHAADYASTGGAAYDFAPLFADVSDPIRGADLAICHLEVPVAPPGTPLSGYPSFAIPADIATGIAATGWDRCSTASNHTNDKGTAGIVATLDALDAAGVAHSGSARTPEEAAAPRLIEHDRATVAHLAYTWGFNATPPAEDWMADVIDADRILTDAAVARRLGARIVVVSLHWGDEYDTSGSADQRTLADRLLASPDIDLIVGHGSHVLQPIEMFHGKYALLSLGNLIANQGSDRPHTYDGLVVSVTFTVPPVGPAAAAPPVAEPTWYDRDAARVRLVRPALADPSLSAIHDRLAASLERIGEIVGPYLAPA